VSLLIEIEPHAIEDLDKLKRMTGAETYEELLNEAITLAYWFFRERQRGHSVASVDEDAHTYKTVDTPLLGGGSRTVAAPSLAVAARR